MSYHCLSALVLYIISDVVPNCIKASVLQINKFSYHIMPFFSNLVVTKRFFLPKINYEISLKFDIYLTYFISWFNKNNI